MRIDRRSAFAGLLLAGTLALSASPVHALSLFPDLAIHAILSGGGVVPAIVTDLTTGDVRKGDP